jgi:hypothetical protein
VLDLHCDKRGAEPRRELPIVAAVLTNRAISR